MAQLTHAFSAPGKACFTTKEYGRMCVKIYSKTCVTSKDSDQFVYPSNGSFLSLFA